MTCYIHHVPGRLRIRTPMVKNNKTAAEEVKELLLSSAGVDDVAINLITGSCLVTYDPLMTKRDDIVSMLSARGYFDRSGAITNDEYIQNIASKFFSLVVSLV